MRDKTTRLPDRLVLCEPVEPETKHWRVGKKQILLTVCPRDFEENLRIEPQLIVTEEVINKEVTEKVETIINKTSADKTRADKTEVDKTDTNKTNADEINKINMLQRTETELASMSADDLLKTQSYCKQQLTSYQKALSKIDTKLIELGIKQYHFERSIDLSVELAPCFMLAVWENNQIEQVAIVVSMSMRGCLFSTQVPPPSSITILRCHSPLGNFKIKNCHINKMNNSIYELVIEEFDDHTEDRMRWVEMLSRINKKSVTI